jgi:hypothetical protein
VPPVLKIAGFFTILGAGILTMRKLLILVTSADKMRELKRPQLTLFQKGLLLAATSTVVLGTAFANNKVLSAIFASAELLCWAFTFFNIWSWSLRYALTLDRTFDAYSRKSTSIRHGKHSFLGKVEPDTNGSTGGSNKGETKMDTDPKQLEPEHTAEQLALSQKMARTKHKLKSNMMVGVLGSTNVFIVYFVLLSQLWIRDAEDGHSSSGCTLRESFNTIFVVRNCLGIMGIVAVHLAWIQTTVIFFLSWKDKRNSSRKMKGKENVQGKGLFQRIFKNKKPDSPGNQLQEISQYERSSIIAQ